jgi:osmoprotectant transport system substrate-binding protein
MSIDRRSFLAASAMLLAGCAVRPSGLSIGSKNFTEQLLLGELLAQYLGRFTAAPIEKRFYLAGTYICHQALLAGRIDMYVEYTGTALVAILKQPPASDPLAVFNTVRSQYQSKFNVAVLPSLGFNNTFAMVMRGSDARRLRLRTLSDAAAIAPQLRLGVGYEFLERADGYAGLAAKYGLRFKQAPRVMDLGLLYRALQNNQVDLVAGSNTDGLIAALDLVVLEDDRYYFPPYDAVPLVRHDALQRFPALATTLQRLSGRISAEEMRRMNYAVDGQKRDASAVVKEFIDNKLAFAADATTP